MEKIVNLDSERASEMFAASKDDSADGAEINASGHRQELDRNFSLLSICGVAITTGVTWLPLGGSIVCVFQRLGGVRERDKTDPR